MSTLRKYVTQADVERYANITITDSDEADDVINLAEEMIDQFVGFQQKATTGIYYGIAESGTTTTMTDASADSQIKLPPNILSFCILEIISGTNAGEKRRIISSGDNDGVITVDEAFGSAIDSTSVYKIYQLAKFPRIIDEVTIGQTTYRSVPEAIKRATLAQMEYIIERGVDYFLNATDKQSEGIGDYNYSIVQGAQRMIAPKARLILKGIRNIKGQMIDG